MQSVYKFLDYYIDLSHINYISDIRYPNGLWVYSTYCIEIGFLPNTDEKEIIINVETHKEWPSGERYVYMDNGDKIKASPSGEAYDYAENRWGVRDIDRTIQYTKQTVKIKEEYDKLLESWKLYKQS